MILCFFCLPHVDIRDLPSPNRLDSNVLLRVSLLLQPPECWCDRPMLSHRSQLACLHLGGCGSFEESGHLNHGTYHVYSSCLFLVLRRKPKASNTKPMLTLSYVSVCPCLWSASGITQDLGVLGKGTSICQAEPWLAFSGEGGALVLEMERGCTGALPQSCTGLWLSFCALLPSLDSHRWSLHEVSFSLGFCGL